MRSAFRQQHVGSRLGGVNSASTVRQKGRELSSRVVHILSCNYLLFWGDNSRTSTIITIITATTATAIATATATTTTIIIIIDVTFQIPPLLDLKGPIHIAVNFTLILHQAACANRSWLGNLHMELFIGTTILVILVKNEIPRS